MYILKKEEVSLMKGIRNRLENNFLAHRCPDFQADK
jgi:hypothetical protein